MEDILRKHHVLSSTIVEVLNKQVKMEAQASMQYLAMAAWCDIRGYEKSAKFFFDQSDGEREHQMKIFHYLVDMECNAVSPGLEENVHDFSSLRSLFEKGLEMEIAVSDAIHDIVRVCRKEGDIATEEFMRWFVMEQIEEEYIMRQCIELFNVLGEEKIALGMFEERVLGIHYEGDEG